MREDFSILSSELHLKFQVNKYNFHFFSKRQHFVKMPPNVLFLSLRMCIFLFILFTTPSTPALCGILDLSSPNRGLNPRSLQWKNRALTTGLLGKSLYIFISDLYLGSSLALNCIHFIISRVCKTSVEK